MAYARTWAIENAAARAAGQCPCKGCEDRQPSCAGFCNRYKEWKQQVSENRAKMLEQDRGEREATAYQRESFDKAVRNHEIKEVKWGNRSKGKRYT